MFNPLPAVRLATVGSRRFVPVVSALILLSGGLWAVAVHNAPRALAATVITDGLDISVNPGSVIVGFATVSANVTYTCTDPNASQAAVRVSFDQQDNDASGEAAVPCGSSRVNKTQTVTAGQLGMSGSQEITMNATLTDGTDAATGAATTLADQMVVRIDPTLTFPGDGTVMLTGSYNCGSAITTPASDFITATQNGSGGTPVFGMAGIPITTCNGTNQSFSATIKSTTGNGYNVVQTNLVSDTPGLPAIGDPDLVNPWGVSFGGNPSWTGH